MRINANSITYDGTDDAERILETVLARRNWTVELRDALSLALEETVNGHMIALRSKHIREIKREKTKQDRAVLDLV